MRILLKSKKLRMKQLTAEEIQELFDFVKARGLKYYDIQIEVVDHFASAIEANWETYLPSWSFEQKIASVYEDLELKGFTKMIRAKSIMVYRKSLKMAFSYVKNAVQLPHVFVTLILIYFLHQEFLFSERPHKIFSSGIFYPFLMLFSSTSLLYAYYYLFFKHDIHAFEQSYSFLGLIPPIPIILMCLVETQDFPCSSEMYLLVSVMIILNSVFYIGIFGVLWKILWESKNSYEALSKT